MNGVNDPHSITLNPSQRGANKICMGVSRAHSTFFFFGRTVKTLSISLIEKGYVQSIPHHYIYPVYLHVITTQLLTN